MVDIFSKVLLSIAVIAILVFGVLLSQYKQKEVDELEKNFPIKLSGRLSCKLIDIKDSRLHGCLLCHNRLSGAETISCGTETHPNE